MAEEATASYAAESGLEEVILENGFTKVEQGEHIVTHVENTEDLHEAIRDAILINKLCLHPKELKFLRKELKQSRAKFGNAIGLSAEYLTYNEECKRDIDPYLSLFIKCHVICLSQKVTEAVEDIMPKLKVSDARYIAKHDGEMWNVTKL